MIAAILLMAATAAAEGDAYRACVLNSATRYARSSERAADVVEAALGKCLDAEASMRDAYYNEGWTPERFQKFLSMIQPKLRSLAMSKVIDARMPNPR